MHHAETIPPPTRQDELDPTPSSLEYLDHHAGIDGLFDVCMVGDLQELYPVHYDHTICKQSKFRNAWVQLRLRGVLFGTITTKNSVLGHWAL